jgi:hypothetical protein
MKKSSSSYLVDPKLIPRIKQYLSQKASSGKKAQFTDVDVCKLISIIFIFFPVIIFLQILFLTILPQAVVTFLRGFRDYERKPGGAMKLSVEKALRIIENQSASGPAPQRDEAKLSKLENDYLKRKRK